MSHENFAFDITYEDDVMLKPSAQLLASRRPDEQIVTVEVTSPDSKDRFVMFLALFTCVPRVGEVVTLENQELAEVKKVIFKLVREELDGKMISRYQPYLSCESI